RPDRDPFGQILRAAARKLLNEPSGSTSMSRAAARRAAGGTTRARRAPLRIRLRLDRAAFGVAPARRADGARMERASAPFASKIVTRALTSRARCFKDDA